jgi:hypothetical protein
MNPAVVQESTAQINIREAERWVTEQAYATIHSISRQTLTNWRYQDKRAGRDHAAPGFPEYRRFGRAVRYRLR